MASQAAPSSTNANQRPAQAASSRWTTRYRAKNGQDPPAVYEELNSALLQAEPGSIAKANLKPGETLPILPRLPTEQDFEYGIETRIVKHTSKHEALQYVVVVLHGFAQDVHNESLVNFVDNHLAGPQTACVLVRGMKRIGQFEPWEPDPEIPDGSESDDLGELPQGGSLGPGAHVGLKGNDSVPIEQPDSLHTKESIFVQPYDTKAFCWSDDGGFFGDGPQHGRLPPLPTQPSWKSSKGKQKSQSQHGMDSPAGPSRSNTGFTLGKPNDDAGNPTFANSTRRIGLEVVIEGLIKTCGFQPRNIAIAGHDQGGSAALAIALACWEVQLGGIVSIGGPLPSDFPDKVQSPTHILLLGGTEGDVIPTQVTKIKDAFPDTTVALMPGTDDISRINDAELQSFLAHQRREEWTKQAVLTFDGGGIRGYGTLLMLKALMERIARYEKQMDMENERNGKQLIGWSSFSPCEYPPIQRGGESEPRLIHELHDDQLFLPCHYFTYIGGTSTGGLLSIMLSRFRMTVHDCIREYQRLGEAVFGHPRLPGAKYAWFKFSAERLEEVILDVATRHGETQNGNVMYPSSEQLCKTIVAARAEKTGSTTPFLFRTYSTRDNTSEPSRTFVKKPLNPGPAANCSIREVARATSAAPTYFKPIEINNWGIDDSVGFLPKIEFIDGGFGTNNPSHEIFKDVKHNLNGNNEVFDTFASFGTGLHPHELKGKLSSLWRQFQELKAHATETQRADDAMKDESRAQEKNDHRKFDFFRFDGGKDLGKVPMDDWSGRRRRQVLSLISTRQTGLETLQTMDRAVDKYLRKSREAQNDMDELAKILVRRRRLRTKDKVAWERYACDLRWECSQPDCNAMAETPDAFQAHLNQEHQELTETQAAIKTCFQESRKCWVYKGISEE